MDGRDLIKKYEGLHDGNRKTAILEPQPDPVGLYTLGWGARYDKNGKPVTKDTPAITLEEADQLLIRDLKRVEDAILKYITVPLSQNEFNAIASFTYNCGTGALQKSTLCSKINTKQPILEKYFTDYSKATQGGKKVVLPGLLKRRQEEYKLFING